MHKEQSKTSSKTLHLVLTKKWFDMILSGEKKEEYRKCTEYWAKRLIEETYHNGGEFKDFDWVEFRHGYQTDAPRIRFEFKGIDLGFGNAAWGAPQHKVFRIKLGKQVEIASPPATITTN